MPDSDQSPPLLSRSGRTNPLGKMTAEIPKVKVPEETREILEFEAREAGMNLSEFVRMILMVRAHGVDAILSMEKERMAVVVGSGGEKSAS